MDNLLIAAENPLLSPNPGLMIWTLITFVSSMIILKWLAFGKIQEALDKRRQSIADSVDAAEKANTEARQLLDEYRAQLSSAKQEAGSIIADARKTGDELTSRIKAEGEEQRRKAIADTQAQVQSEIEKAVFELRTSVADMTVLAAERVLRGSLDVQAHAGLIKQAVDELDFKQLEKVGSGA